MGSQNFSIGSMDGKDAIKDLPHIGITGKTQSCRSNMLVQQNNFLDDSLLRELAWPISTPSAIPLLINHQHT